jgi:hypothetical protein
MLVSTISDISWQQLASREDRRENFLTGDESKISVLCDCAPNLSEKSKVAMFKVDNAEQLSKKFKSR